MSIQKGLTKVLTGAGSISGTGVPAVVKAIGIETVTTGAAGILRNGQTGDILWRFQPQGNFNSTGLSYFFMPIPGPLGILCTNEAFMSFSGTIRCINVLYDKIQE